MPSPSSKGTQPPNEKSFEEKKTSLIKNIDAVTIIVEKNMLLCLPLTYTSRKSTGEALKNNATI